LKTSSFSLKIAFKNKNSLYHFFISEMLKSVIISILVLLLFGCKTADKKPLIEEKQPITVAVLDFKAPNNPENEKSIKGWWFGSRDIYKNKNAGINYSDIFAEELEKSGLFQVYKRSELKYYMGDLRGKLKKQYPALADENNKNKFEEIVTNIDPLIIGKDLGVDKILVGEVDSCYTAHSRAFHTWASKVNISAKIVDVKTGKTEWEGKYKNKDEFSAPNILSKKSVNWMIKNIKKKYLF